jgi:hypothetical protein
MARSRKQAWLRDELVLALDLYRRDGRNPSSEAVRDVSDLLRAMPVEPELASDPTFRNPNGVQLKVSNFVAIDPDAETEGMSRGGRGDREVWDEFAGDWTRLATAASAIRANLAAVTPQEAETDEEEIADAPEGRILTPHPSRPGTKPRAGRKAEGQSVEHEWEARVRRVRFRLRRRVWRARRRLYRMPSHGAGLPAPARQSDEAPTISHSSAPIAIA